MIDIFKKKFECPICGYRGVFKKFNSTLGIRKYAKCPECGALERHRLQYLAMRQLTNNIDFSKSKILHFAPEQFLSEFFINRFGRYETADLKMKGVDHKVDLTALPFEDKTYDLVFASHVLEHIQKDEVAIKEIHRILKPGGIAVLPVPLIAKRTVEYPEPSPTEDYHVRAPGEDYFERYKPFFSRVTIINSAEFPDRYQLYIHEDRSKWPSDKCPLRPAMNGDKHVDFVPICYV